MKTFIIGFFTLISVAVNAQKIQIVHTNDLHSHLDHAVHRPYLGGYARVKVMIEKFRQEAAMDGIGTIAMDGGDFMEGNLYYMANKGKKTFEIFNQLGHDVAVLGNHDYLMGADDLEEILEEYPPSYKLLAANFKLSDDFKAVKKNIKPVWETVVSGVKVGVIGITLNDLLYKWRLKGDGKLSNEVDYARYYAKYLKDRGNQVIIALTHIGLSKDKKLAFNVPELDLIVGGHSHTEIHEVIYHKSFDGKKIPIVQAGKFGEWIGRLTLDYDKAKKKVTVHDYKLHAIDTPIQDPEVLSLIEDANNDLNDLYGQEWLNSVVGQSYLSPVHVKNEEVTWNFFINDSMLESSHADFSVHTTALSGDNYPVGDVTRRDLYNGNPRTFDYKDKYGYYVYTAEVSGLLIKLLTTACLNLNAPLYFSGISFQWKKKSNGKYKVWDVRHKGEKINIFKRYKVSFSEAIVRGGYSISKLVGLILHNGQRTKTTMWEALEKKFKREGQLYSDYLDRYYRQGLLKDGRTMERVVVKPQDL
jgi:5'-nucleotidase/UDP-sugar diphosphatase